jgi:CRP-like cAMP-binding protein
MAGRNVVVDRRIYHPDDIIIREGDKGYSFYIVESGLVEVYKMGPEGYPVVIGRIGAGGIFGEMAIIDNSERMASVRAVTTTVVKALPRDYLDKRLARLDPVVRGILKVFSGHIRFLTELQAQQGISLPPTDRPVEDPELAEYYN